MNKSLEQLALQARELANDLFKNTGELQCFNINPSTSCLMKEENRPLTSKEKDQGWTLRPFYGYDLDRMCASCRSYWMVEMAAQDLHRLNCLRQREAARKEVNS